MNPYPFLENIGDPSSVTVAVGMSGGVDSSVSALILKELGFKVIGLFMKNWDDEDCPAVQDFADVQRVAAKLDIPCYPINLTEAYWNLVFKQFLEEYQAGHTPNPDILCNREIKFNVFLKKALSLGADYLATGHYAQNRVIDCKHHLLRGRDPDKDQSYFLYTLNESILQKVIFPIGHLPKTEVREIARQAQLATADKKDSVGICFIGKRNFKEFLSNYLPSKPGKIENLEGDVVGQHDGICYYTIGQRKGLKIGGPGEAWFVLAKDVARNVLIVAQGDHPSLYSSTLVAKDLSWVAKAPPPLPFKCTAKVRYRQKDAACILEKIEGGRLYVSFIEPQKAVTARQSIVLYDGDCCLGGGIIEASG